MSKISYVRVPQTKIPEMCRQINELKEKNNELYEGTIELAKEKMENQKYIVECEREIEQLKEELETLRNANASYEELLAGDEGTIDKIFDLQKENKQLQEDCDQFKMNGGYLGENCANYMVSKLKDDLIIQLREENKKLKKERDEKEEEGDQQYEELQELKEKYEQLEEENEELKSLYPRESKEYIDIAENCSLNIYNKYICGHRGHLRHLLFDPSKKLEINDSVGRLFEPFMKLMIRRENTMKEEIEKLKEKLEKLKK